MNRKINMSIVKPEELKDQPVITTLDQLFCMELIDLQMNNEKLLMTYYDRTVFVGRAPEKPVTVVYGKEGTPYFNIREVAALMGKREDIDAFISDHYDELGVVVRIAAAPHKLELIDFLPTTDIAGIRRLAELLDEEADSESVAATLEFLEEKAVAWGKQCYA
ncbi:hypothetical protein [Eubacterium sp. 1001713B170207_170306_E7]|uniref:hypothetical protein n=1 Tax=Eubacterium sp. 1001713B170207_170306_E7 TaxID=2787097 RepID=UPI00189B28C8|nr:hypothetical protein [Eubacterium sp. 1001713B170207_170306_E7]